MLRFLAIFVLLLFVVPSSLFAGNRFSARVTRVIDGDSIKVRAAGRYYEVRLYGIDAPEVDQSGAGLSKSWLTDYLLDFTVAVEAIAIDKYDRLVAIVYKDGEAVNRVSVAGGYAWVYPRYCRKKICRNWKKDEELARKNHLAIWQKKRVTPPWVWRHRK